MLRLLLVAGIAFASAAAWAQPDPALFYDYSVAGVYDGSGVNLEIRLNTSTVIDPSSVLSEAVGVDVYRVPFDLYTLQDSYCQTTTTRITGSPLPWTSATTAPLSFRDDQAAAERVYFYVVRLVNAARQEVPAIFGWGFPLDGIVKTGDVPLGHGWTEPSPYGPWYLWGCERECTWGGEVYVPQGVDIPQSATGVWWWYGDIGYHDPQNGWRLTITRAEAAPGCIVAVTPAPWSSVKALYR